jgi:hypothetical protein
MSGPYGMQHLKNQYCSNCKRKKLEDRVYNYSDNPTLFKRHVETGNHGVSCFHHLRPIGLPLNPMKCGIGLYASYGMESNRKADQRRDKLPSGEGGGCEEIKAIAM